MKPFMLITASLLNLKIVPDAEMHMDGHPILTYSYSIYRSNTKTLLLDETIAEEGLSGAKDPDFMGVILLQDESALFTYRPGLLNQLTADDVDELLAYIRQYRLTPSMWLI